MFEQRLSDFECFKELLSQKLLSICEDITEVKGMFTQFVTVQQKKTSKEVVITDLKEILESHLKFESDKVMACVQSDIEEVKKKLKSQQEDKVKQTQLLLYDWFTNFVKPKETFKPFKMEQSRKLEIFGHTNSGNWPVDFEWPTKDGDIEPSKDGKPVKVLTIDWFTNNNCYL